MSSEQENVTETFEEQEDQNYKAPPQKTIEEIMNLDEVIHFCTKLKVKFKI